MNLDQSLQTPILTIDDAKAFIQMLHDTGTMYHLEDDPHEIEWFEHEPLTSQQADLMEIRVDELYSFDWGKHTDPIGYYLDVVNPNIEDKPEI